MVKVVLLFSSDVVHGYLPDVSKTVLAGADLLIVEANACKKSELISFHQKMQGLRSRARIQKAALFKQLCDTLITPFDHDDLYLLSQMLTSTMDEILDASEILRSWPYSPAPESVQDLCRVVGEACHAVDRSIRAFLTKSLVPRDFRDFFRIRDEANEILNVSLGKLFETESDSSILLQKRDLYKHPHAAVVLCGQTAASLRSIVLKNG